jgi:predicted protein tyrosine phosphatase
MEPVSISLLTICGLEELESHGERGVTHVLSIIDPHLPDPEVFAGYRPHQRTVLRFHDIIDSYPGMVMPERRHVREILDFGHTLAEDAKGRTDGHLLVHCHAGVSRSTAAMTMLLAQVHPDEDEDRLFERLVGIRPQAWPNSVMIDFADDLLGRGGRLAAALERHYHRQLERRPTLVEYMRTNGRAREVERARG